MGLPELIDALDHDAEVELERHRRADAATAERLRTDAAAAAAAVVTAAVTAADQEATARVQQDLATVRAAAAAELRRQREAALAAVHRAARDQLAKRRTEPDYENLLAASLAEALRALPGADRVHIDPRDAEIAAVLLARENRRVRLVPDLTCWGGVVAAAPGRRVDNTLESRLEGAWPRLRSAMAAAWTAEDSGDHAGARGAEERFAPNRHEVGS